MSRRKETLRVAEVTPLEYACPPFGGCPGIYRTSRGSYIIVGKAVTSLEGAPNMRARIGPSEAAVEVPRGLIDLLDAPQGKPRARGAR